MSAEFDFIVTVKATNAETAQETANVMKYIRGVERVNRFTPQQAESGLKDIQPFGELVRDESLSVGEVARRWRKSLGLSQIEAATNIKTTQGFISDFENSKDPKVNTVKKIAQALSVPVNLLIDGFIPDISKSDVINQ